MKRSHWLDVAEYTLLLGTGVGSVASAVSQQVAYTLTPLSLLVAIGLFNRQKTIERSVEHTTAIVELSNQEIFQELDVVHQEVTCTPTAAAFENFQQSLLQNNREALARFSEQAAALRHRVDQNFKILEDLGLNQMRHDIYQLQDEFTHLGETLSGITAHLRRLPTLSRVEGLESEIASLKMEMMQVRVSLERVSQETRSSVNPLQDQIESLHLQMRRLSQSSENSLWRQEIGELIKAVTDLVPKRDFLPIVQGVQDLREQHQTLRQNLFSLEATLQAIHAKVDETPTHMQAEVALRQELGQVEAALASVQEQVDSMALAQATASSSPSSPHELLLALPPANTTASSSSSHTVLETVLSQVKSRLILVWPWSNPELFDEALVQQFCQLLEQGIEVSIGWCHWGDRQDGRFLPSLQQRWSIAPPTQPCLQAILKQLLPLKQQFPQQFTFKILGTDEHFLVCDRQFAILGLQSLAANNTLFPSLDVKLRTSDPQVMQQLTQRFDHPVIDLNNTTAFFNRGTTRYDLQDYAGAVEDYTQVIRLSPKDGIAYNSRGLARYSLGDRQGALEDFSQALQCDPWQLAPYCNRAVVHTELGDWLAALNDFSAALTVDPDSPIAYFHRAIIRQEQGNWRSALVDFNHALARSSQPAMIYCYRGALYQRLSRDPEAIADLEAAIQLFTEQGDTDNAQRITQTLKRLKSKRSQRQPAHWHTPWQQLKRTATG